MARGVPRGGEGVVSEREQQESDPARPRLSAGAAALEGGRALHLRRNPRSRGACVEASAASAPIGKRRTACFQPGRARSRGCGAPADGAPHPRSAGGVTVLAYWTAADAAELDVLTHELARRLLRAPRTLRRLPKRLRTSSKAWRAHLEECEACQRRRAAHATGWPCDTSRRSSSPTATAASAATPVRR